MLKCESTCMVLRVINSSDSSAYVSFGITSEDIYSKSWDNLSATPDIVITVCGNAGGETYPAYLDPALCANWGVDDPAEATGTEETINAAITQAYRILREGIETFLSLPLDDLQQNPAAFRTKLDVFGGLKFKQQHTKL